MVLVVAAAEFLLIDMFLSPQKFACNGTVIEHPEYGEVIQLQGDQRKNICQFLIEVGVRPDVAPNVCSQSCRV